MSDRDERGVLPNTNCHTCGVWPCRCVAPAGASAPLSPIALDQEVGLDFEAAWVEADPLKGRVITEGYLDREILNTQLRAIVARVAQEEREKLLDKMAQMAEGYRDALKIEGVSEYTESRVRQNRDALLLVIDLLRGTP